MPASVRTNPAHRSSPANACCRSIPGVAGPGVRSPEVTSSMRSWRGPMRIPPIMGVSRRKLPDRSEAPPPALLKAAPDPPDIQGSVSACGSAPQRPRSEDGEHVNHDLLRLVVVRLQGIEHALPVEHVVEVLRMVAI